MVLAVSIAQAVEVGDAVALPEAQLFDGTRAPGGTWWRHPVIIATWASRCSSYALQNSCLQKPYDTTRGTDLRILVISIDTNPQFAKDYVTKRGFTLPVMMEIDALCAVTGPRKDLPELLVLDAKGCVARKEVSEMPEDDVADLARHVYNPKQ